MDIFTYYRPAASAGSNPKKRKKHLSHDRELLSLWEKTWKKNGWNPVVLHSRDYPEQDEWYDRLLGKINTLPTVNPRDYENACYLRWLAMYQVARQRAGEVLWMSDYDVMNHGVSPFDQGPELTIHDSGGTPCLVSGDAKAYERLLGWFLDCTGEIGDGVDDIGNDKAQPELPHTSDMLICKRHQNAGQVTVTRLCSPLLKVRQMTGEKPKIVHYNAGSAGSPLNKVALITSEHRELKSNWFERWFRRSTHRTSDTGSN